MQLFVQWFKRTSSDPQLVVLLTLLVGGFVVVITMGDMLLPVLAALVIAYLLEAWWRHCSAWECRGWWRWASSSSSFSLPWD